MWTFIYLICFFEIKKQYICLGHTVDECDWLSFLHICLPLLTLRDTSHFFSTKALRWKTLPGSVASLSLGKKELRYSISHLDWAQWAVKAVQAKDPAASASFPQHCWQAPWHSWPSLREAGTTGLWCPAVPLEKSLALKLLVCRALNSYMTKSSPWLGGQNAALALTDNN